MSQFLQEAVRQARAIFPNASQADIGLDLQDIVGKAHAVAVSKFPNDQRKQEKYVSNCISTAIQRQLGSLRLGTMH